MPIESTIFAYKALVADAESIAGAICGPGKEDPPTRSTGCERKSFVLAAQADIVGLEQWRAVIAQIDVLRERTSSASLAAIKTSTPLYSPSDAQLRCWANPATNCPAAQQQMSIHSSMIASSADVQNLAQTGLTLFGSFAVSESLSPASGSMTDLPLTNMVAEALREKGGTVYIPTAYPPNLVSQSDFAETIIKSHLDALEVNRAGLQAALVDYATAMASATSAAKTLSSPDYAKALAFTQGSPAVVSLLTSLQSQIDSLESSLFSGQNASPSQGTNQANQQGTSNVSPLLTNPGPNTGGNTGQQQSTPSNGGGVLSQILGADLLVRKIWSDRTVPDNLAALHILMVHALESGGGQLTKANLFTGTKVYFGGGSVATFAVFNSDGAAECSGVVYGYRGYVREKSFESELNRALPEYPVLSDCTTALASSSTSQSPGPNPSSQQGTSVPKQ
jgi:hypothetical protein